MVSSYLSQKAMKLVTYNIFVESPAAGIIADLSRLIEQEDPDFFCLQEYAPHHNLRQLFDETGYNYVEFEYYRNKNKSLSLLIAYKRYESERHIWSTTLNDYFPGNREGKGILGMSFKLGDQTVSIINVHLPIWNSIKNKLSIIQQMIKQQVPAGSQTIICGDFNIGNNRSDYLEASMQKLGLRSVSVRGDTYKGGKIKRRLLGVLQLDWIFTNEEYAQAVDSEIITAAKGSDHYPVIVRF
jgi:endonuclease/exonuclease/phosphatase family metal-dependent hydrolase